MSRASIHCLLFAVVALGAGCDGDDERAAPSSEERESAQPESITVGIAIPSYVHAVAWIADDRGYFRAHDLDADVQVMGGSSATMRALLAGSADVGIAGGDAVIQANAAGAELVVVAGLVDRFYHRIVARQEIASMQELRGKRIGLPFLGGPQDLAVRYALRSNGLRYGEDVQVVNLGRELNRMAALSRGDIDATTSQTPPSRLQELGLHVLQDLPAEDQPFPYAVVVVQRRYLEEHEGRVRSALHALCDGALFYRSHRDESLAIVGEHIAGSDTEEAARERYESSGPSLLSMPPRPNPAGFQMVLDFLDTEETRAMEPAELFDLRVLESLLEGGHCQPR